MEETRGKDIPFTEGPRRERESRFSEAESEAFDKTVERFRARREGESPFYPALEEAKRRTLAAIEEQEKRAATATLGECFGYAILYGLGGVFPGILGWAIGAAIAPVLGVVLLIGGPVIGIILGFMAPIRKARATAKAQEAARLQRHRDEQQRYHKELLDLGDRSLGLFESMPTHLESAEKWLDKAADDFAERAFAPFWDSIENAVKCLAHCDEGVRRIKDNSSRYTELVREYEGMPPHFPIGRESVDKLGVGTATAERMQAMVRKAQRDFEFAMIYEQRKTNQILVAGFENLAQALEEMTWQITASIDGLAGSVRVMTSTLNESMRAIHSRLGDIAEMTGKQDDERAERERKALEMLDNIQRRRRPAF